MYITIDICNGHQIITKHQKWGSVDNAIYLNIIMYIHNNKMYMVITRINNTRWNINIGVRYKCDPLIKNSTIIYQSSCIHFDINEIILGCVQNCVKSPQSVRDWRLELIRWTGD